jgi:hypothetical protein
MNAVFITWHVANSMQVLDKLGMVILIYKIIWWEAAMECLATEQPSHFLSKSSFGVVSQLYRIIEGFILVKLLIISYISLSPGVFWG